jgi:excinuclease ABC subunit C
VTALQKALALAAPPVHVECFDISHFQGHQTVASMVCFVGGRPNRDHYRKFKIRDVAGIDDFKSMHEVVFRRYKRLQAEKAALPDLILIDGGKGQLSAAVKALREAGLTNVPVFGLAKRNEELYKPGRSRPIIIERDSPTLFLVQRVRDEAHRFAITRHRARRGRAALRSKLDVVPGLGPVRRRALLGSIDAIRDAPVEQLSTVVPRPVALRVKELL